MRSYDYCHFEVCLGSDENLTLLQIDEMRKDAMHLVDKAVRQYQIAKEDRNFHSIDHSSELEDLKNKVKVINENFPKSEWTPEQKAVIKRYEDLTWRLNHEYDYGDDWEF